jgi:hypothetical protein
MLLDSVRLRSLKSFTDQMEYNIRLPLKMGLSWSSDKGRCEERLWTRHWLQKVFSKSSDYFNALEHPKICEHAILYL